MERSLHLHSAAINQIKDLITVTDLDGFIAYVNDAECFARGKARDDLIGQHVSIYGTGSAAEEKSEDIIQKSVQNGFWRGLSRVQLPFQIFRIPVICALKFRGLIRILNIFHINPLNNSYEASDNVFELLSLRCHMLTR